MINGKEIPTPFSMLARWQEEYAAAFCEKRLPDMIRNAQRLYQFYTALGNSILARKWTEEYIRCWSQRNDPPEQDHGTSVMPDLVEPGGVVLTLSPARPA